MKKGLANGQQLPFQGQLGGASSLGLGMGAGFGPVVNLVDGVGPLRQLSVLRIEDLQVVNVPQQMNPAALLWAVVMVVGGVEIADQDAGEGVAQSFIHHFLVATPPQEVARRWCAESPHVAVVSILTPAGLVGMDHWAGADLGQNPVHCGLGLLRGAMHRRHDCSQAEAQPMDGAQIPLDDGDGQSGLLSERGNQTDQVDTHALLAHHHAVHLCRGNAAASAPRTIPGDVDVLGNFRRNLGQVDDLPRALGPATGQQRSAVGTVVHHMLHPTGGCHATAGKAVGPGLAWRFGLGRFLAGFGFDTGHPPGATGFGPPFQLSNPLLQALDDGLLSGYDGLLPYDDGDEHIAVSSGQVDFRIHTRYMT